MAVQQSPAFRRGRVREVRVRAHSSMAITASPHAKVSTNGRTTLCVSRPPAESPASPMTRGVRQWSPVLVAYPVDVRFLDEDGCEPALLLAEMLRPPPAQRSGCGSDPRILVGQV